MQRHVWIPPCIGFNKTGPERRPLVPRYARRFAVQRLSDASFEGRNRLADPCAKGRGGFHLVWILLFEDEASLLNLISPTLRKQRYTVLEARNAREAMLALAQASGRIDLLLTDVILPDISGPQLTAQLVDATPRSRCSTSRDIRTTISRIARIWARIRCCWKSRSASIPCSRRSGGYSTTPGSHDSRRPSHAQRDTHRNCDGRLA